MAIDSKIKCQHLFGKLMSDFDINLPKKSSHAVKSTSSYQPWIKYFDEEDDYVEN